MHGPDPRRGHRAGAAVLALGQAHTTLLYAPDGPVDVATYEQGAAAAVSAAHGRMDVYLIAAPGADVTATELPLIRDTAGEDAWTVRRKQTVSAIATARGDH